VAKQIRLTDARFAQKQEARFAALKESLQPKS
jgi:hypothetical protein